jgi:hypothetical protein
LFNLIIESNTHKNISTDINIIVILYVTQTIMKITKCIYGDVDCLNVIKSKIKNNKLVIRVDNSIIGDTNPGVVKYLDIEIDNISMRIREGDTLVYPKSSNNRLGVWYSNDQSNHPSIKKSIETLKLASDGKADIITCVWNEIPDNPFTEIISWNKNSSHLNQLLQILQCIYTAKTMGDYEYVSFLEHDVMYPIGYFDYPEFENGEILTNMNYGGINKTGWQHRGQNDEPMHQMTMKVNDALIHLHSILGNALVTNSGLIESQNMIRKQWNSLHQSIHINHGLHFTSHYTIYTKNNTYMEHPYWGNHTEYIHLFK